MEHVQFHRLHPVEGAIDDVERLEMPALVEHQSAPGKPGIAVDCPGRNRGSLWGPAHQLQKGLQAVQDAQRIGGLQVNLTWHDLQVVGLVLFYPLHGRARTARLDEERRLIELRLMPKRDPGLPGKNIQEALLSPFQPRLLIAFESDPKPVVDDELARTRRGLQGKRHQSQGSLRLNASRGRKAKYQSHRYDPKHERPHAQRFYLV